MSLLSSYEGLRQEIQRLARENEELRRLVRLVQENQELRLVLRDRASGLGFCGPGLLAEVASSPRLPRRRTAKFKDAGRGGRRRARWAAPGEGLFPGAREASPTPLVPSLRRVTKQSEGWGCGGGSVSRCGGDTTALSERRWSRGGPE